MKRIIFAGSLIVFFLSSFYLNSLSFASNFTDVDEESSIYLFSEYAYAKGIFEGYPDGSLGVDSPINRAELAKVLVASLGEQPDLDSYNNCFTDVSEEWFAPWVCYGKEKGYWEGYADGSFGVDQDVNTAEFIKMLTTTQGISIPDELNIPYDDVVTDAWYAPYVAALVEANVLGERGENLGVSSARLRGDVTENMAKAVMLREAEESVFNAQVLESSMAEAGLSDLIPDAILYIADSYTIEGDVLVTDDFEIDPDGAFSSDSYIQANMLVSSDFELDGGRIIADNYELDNGEVSVWEYGGQDIVVFILDDNDYASLGENTADENLGDEITIQIEEDYEIAPSTISTFDLDPTNSGYCSYWEGRPDTTCTEDFFYGWASTTYSEQREENYDNALDGITEFKEDERSNLIFVASFRSQTVTIAGTATTIYFLEDLYAMGEYMYYSENIVNGGERANYQSIEPVTSSARMIFDDAVMTSYDEDGDTVLTLFYSPTSLMEAVANTYYSDYQFGKTTEEYGTTTVSYLTDISISGDPQSGNISGESTEGFYTTEWNFASIYDDQGVLFNPVNFSESDVFTDAQGAEEINTWFFESMQGVINTMVERF